MELGKYNTLKIVRETEPGLFLEDIEENEVLLPNRYVPEEFEIGEEIKVFVYLDNEERIVATTDEPFITRDEFGLLRCNEVNKFGAFLDWGLVKELFCQFKEQVFKTTEGNWYLVRCYLDEESNSLVASSKTIRFLDNDNLTVEPFEEVDVLISHPSDLGMNVIVNGKHSGLIFKEDLFKNVSIGDGYKGMIKNITPDNKLTITLQRIGYRSIEPNADKVMEVLQRKGGVLNLSDKSKPEDIKEQLEMSKKSFKKAIGTLYKKRLIDIEPNKIKLKG